MHARLFPRITPTEEKRIEGTVVGGSVDYPEFATNLSRNIEHLWVVSRAGYNGPPCRSSLFIKFLNHLYFILKIIRNVIDYCGI